jgi:hypothetical protein
MKVKLIKYLSVGCILLSIFLAGAACKSGPKANSDNSVHVNNKGNPPRWFNRLEDDFPEDKYLAVVGEGDTRRDAESDAAGALVRIFGSNIKVETEAIVRYRELEQDSGGSYELEKEATKEVDILAQHMLYNLQYSDPYTDNSGRVHVVGYLDRIKTGQIYKEKIEKNSTRIVSFRKKALTSERLITKFAFIDAAIIFAKNNELLLDQLNIIYTPMRKMVSLPYQLDELNTLYSEIAEQMVFEIQITNDMEDKIANLVAGLLSEKGFSIKRGGVLKVAGDVKLEPLALKNNYENLRWYLNLQMKDESGKTIVSYNKNQRESGVSKSAVEARAYIEMEKQIKKAFFNEFIKYLDSLVLK